MKRLSPSDLSDLKVADEHGMFVQPFLGSGFTKSGIYLEYNARLYPVLARVLVVGPQVIQAKPDEVIVYHPGSFDWVHLDERSFATMDERAILALVENMDSLEPIIKPVVENVLIKPISENENSTFEIVRHRERPLASEGIVIARGPQARGIEANDRVLYVEKKVLVLKLGTDAYHLLPQRHVLGIREAA